jgi:methylated-DNA-[protein]-cysteine S-methyltransferase
MCYNISMMRNIYYYDYPLCGLGIAEEDGAICRVFFDKRTPPPEGFKNAESPLIKKAAAQLAEYFDGKRKTFNLPLAPQGTVFQTKVWKALQNIPFGETRSYGEIAAAAGNPKASRAVGMANNRNPIVIIVPCHRVIGHNGSLTGFGGGIDLKRLLLELEQRG